MNINKITFRNTRAFIFSAFLIALPASATTISFTTTASGSATDNYGASGGADFNFAGATVATTTLSNTSPGTSFTGSLSDSFGELTFASGTPNSNTIDVKLTPTVNGGAAAVVNFDGTLTKAVVSGTTAYFLSFSSTPGSTAGTGTLAGYTELTASNGVTYAIKGDDASPLQLGSSLGKTTWLAGYIIGVPGAVTPEPATLATTGLALGLIGFAVRRKRRVNS